MTPKQKSERLTPEWLAQLRDTIAEGLPADEAAAWNVQLAKVLAALPDDYDWQAALHRVHAAILRITLRFAGAATEIVERVLGLHERAARGEAVSDEEWQAAKSAADAAEAAAWRVPAPASVAAEAAWMSAQAAGAAAQAIAARRTRVAAWPAAEAARRAAKAEKAAAWAQKRTQAAAEEARAQAYLNIRDAIIAALSEASDDR